MFKISPFIESWLLGSRKFLVMAAILLLAIIFRIAALIDGAQMVDLIKMVGIAFMGCNSVEHMCITAQTWIAGQITDKDGDA